MAGETVAATFLFTDLVGSTELSSAMSATEADLLRQTHFGLLRGATEASGGIEVKNLGDGLMVMYTSPSRALAGAVGMQQSIERHNRHAEIALAVRIGLSTGETTEEDGDFFGDPVIEAARLCAQADGGQILATELLRMLVGRHAIHQFVSLGPLELKGLPTPVSAVEVVWEPSPENAATEGGGPLPARLVANAGGGLFGFSGRREELASLDTALKNATSEARLQVVLIGGEPGLGKSTLAAQAARAAHEVGTTVLFGECEEGSGAPYQPWIAALSHYLQHRSADALAGLSPVHAGALRRLMPACAERLPAGELIIADSDTERLVLMDAIVSLLGIGAAQTSVMVVLDDLHWADAASLGLLRHAIRSPVTLPVLIVGTYRPSDLSRAHPLTGLLADLRRESTVSRIELAGLGDLEIVDLMETAAGYTLDERGVDLAHALRHETEGNPFFVTELLRHMSESGAIAQDRDGRYGLSAELDQLTLPASVRDVVARRVARLGDEAVRVLSLAAVLGRDFELDVLAAVAEVDQNALLDLLEQAAAAALMVEAADDPGRFGFAHALIQHTLYQDLGAARRQRVHHRAAEILEDRALSRPQDAGALAELARHWQAATRPTDSAKAVEYTRRAGDAAMEALSPVDAAHWYGQALELAARDPAVADRDRCDLLLRLGGAQLAMDPAQGATTLQQAGALADELGDLELLMTWAFTRMPGWRTSEAADPERLRLALRVLELIGDRDLGRRARLLAMIAEETDPADWRHRRELADAALLAADELGDDTISMEVVLSTLFLSAPDRAVVDGARATRAIEWAKASHNPIALASALQFHASSCLVVGDTERARQAADALTELADSVGLAVVQSSLAMCRVGFSMLDGNLAALERYATSLLELGLSGVPSALAGYGGSVFEMYWAQGRLDQFATQFGDAINELPSYAGFRPALVTMYYETDQPEEARSLFARDAADGFASFPYDSVWAACLLLFSDAAVALNDRVAAAALYERLLPFADLYAATGPIYYGALERPIGRLANLLGRPAEAEQRLRHALDAHRQVGANYWTAATMVDLVEVLVGPDMSDLDVARRAETAQLIEQATALGSAGGYGAVIRRTTALAAILG